MRPTLLFVLGLAACASSSRPHPTGPARTVPFAAQRALDQWVATLRAEAADCRITVNVLTADEARLSFDDPQAKPDPNAPPRQIPVVQFVWVKPFVSEAEVAARREAAKARVDACMADAGPGPHRKGRDMNAESCAILANDGPRIPTSHLERDLSIAVPAYFTTPGVCEKATATLMARMASYP
jgi:hypothetical protein